MVSVGIGSFILPSRPCHNALKNLKSGIYIYTRDIEPHILISNKKNSGKAWGLGKNMFLNLKFKVNI